MLRACCDNAEKGKNRGSLCEDSAGASCFPNRYDTFRGTVTTGCGPYTETVVNASAAALCAHPTAAQHACATIENIFAPWYVLLAPCRGKSARVSIETLPVTQRFDC